MIWYRPLDFDRYNPGNHDPEVGFEFDDFCIEAAKTFPLGSTQREKLMARSDQIQTAFSHQQRDPEVLVNWWDYYPPEYPEVALTLAGGKNLTNCIKGNCSALPQEVSATSR